MIEIPVKPHVKQYLLKNTFIRKPFMLNECDPVGLFLINAIEPKKKASLPLRYNQDRVISVRLGNDKRYNHKMWLPQYKARTFNSFIDSLIRSEFYIFIDTVMLYCEDEKVDRTIRMFEAKYQLQETNLSFGTLKRMFYRNRERFKTPAKSS